jgi:hypothetical protein
VAWLKALVIGMAVLIVGGVVALAVLMVNRMGGSVIPAPAAPGRIELPAGARIAETHVDGKTIVLRLAMPDGSARIALYETSGKLVSMIEVVETKGPSP